jgi:hypothetical protein
MTQDEVFEALKMVYKMEQAAGTWADLMPSKHEITMITTNLAKANNKLNKMKSSGSGGSRGGGGDRGGGTGKGNGNRASKRVVAVATIQPYLACGCSQRPPTPSCIPPKTTT